MKEVGEYCYNLLYPIDCSSTVIAISNKIDYLYLIFIKHDNSDKYIRLLSCSIGYGCVGRLYVLKSRLYNSFEEIWKDTHDWMKIFILENSL